MGEGNGYSYAFNNPVNLADPSGLSISFPDIAGSLGIDLDMSTAVFAVRMTLSVTPILGDLNDAIAIVTGYDVIWGERLS